MPFFDLRTNLSNNKFTPELLKQTSQKVADLLNLAPVQIQIVIAADQLLTFNGTNEPAAILTLTSVSGLGDADINRPVIHGISSFLEQELGLKKDRILLFLHKVDASSVGYNGQLVSDLLEKSKK